MDRPRELLARALFELQVMFRVGREGAKTSIALQVPSVSLEFPDLSKLTMRRSFGGFLR